MFELQLATLVYIFRGDEVLLGRKLGKIGAGRVTAPGGKVQDGETPLAAAIRETEEETGLRPISLSVIGQLLGSHPKYGRWSVAIFTCRNFTGALRASPEFEPAWYPVDAIPMDEMLDGDRHWIRHVLTNTSFRASVRYDEHDRALTIVFPRLPSEPPTRST